MAEPPDGDDTWSSLRDQVEEALRKAGLGDRDLDEAVVQAMEQAFTALGSLSQDTEESTSSPDVTVVEGGRREDDPPAPGEPPELRLAPETSAAADGELSTGDPKVRVTVHRLDRDGRRRTSTTGSSKRKDRRLQMQGRIQVAAEGHQTVFRGNESRSYRLLCTEGTLRIALDGLPAESLSAGQSIDVDAALIRVSGADGAAAAGNYVRLPRQPSR